MNTGMLWFDSSSLSLEKKIEKAIAYYQKKYNFVPDTILVHPSMVKDGTPEIKNITVRPYRPVLPDHIWLGVEDNA